MALSQQRPIVISGFGRSGTTWLADIVSKSTDGVVLFEPLHPLRAPEPLREFAYKSFVDDSMREHYSRCIRRLMNKHMQCGWLVRSYLTDHWFAASEEQVNSAYASSDIVGYKVIRAHFLMDGILDSDSTRVVHIERDPCAVICSIKTRNFWELGWTDTRDAIIRGGLAHPSLTHGERQRIRRVLEGSLSYEQHIAVLWFIVKLVSDKLAWRHNFLKVRFEDLCRHPLTVATQILTFVGADPRKIRPHCLFTPSRTTERSFDGHRDLSSLALLRGTLPHHEYVSVQATLAACGLTRGDDSGTPFCDGKPQLSGSPS